MWPPQLHLFAHFWISRELGIIRHCQDGEGQTHHTVSVTVALQRLTETLSLFYAVAAHGEPADCSQLVGQHDGVHERGPSPSAHMKGSF